MRKTAFTEEQVAYTLRQAEAGTPVLEICRKLGISFWQYVQDRLRRRDQIARLADTIRQRAAEARVVSNAEAMPA